MEKKESPSKTTSHKPVPLKGKGVAKVEDVHAAWTAHKKEQEDKEKKKS